MTRQEFTGADRNRVESIAGVERAEVREDGRVLWVEFDHRADATAPAAVLERVEPEATGELGIRDELLPAAEYQVDVPVAEAEPAEGKP